MHSPSYPKKATSADTPVPGQPDWLEAEIIDIDAPPESPRKNKSFPRHLDWKKIRPYAERRIKEHGPWPTAYAAEVELRNKLQLTISPSAIYRAIAKFFPKWLELDPTE